MDPVLVSRRTPAIEGEYVSESAPEPPPMVNTRTQSIVVVANRLPVHRTEDGQWESSAGGLVTAMAPVLKTNPGVWVGWSGDDAPIRPFTHDGVRIRPVPISGEEIESFYNGMSNRTLWPLYHDAIRTPDFQRDWWASYELVNARFAKAAIREAAEGDLVWVHDYHLQLVPAMIRKMRPDLKIGFFLHIPFPPEELFEWLPWRQQILAGLMGADVVGFQTGKAAQNFARLCREYTSAEGTGSEILFEGRKIISQAFPISIDFGWFDIRSKSPETGKRVVELRKQLGEKRKILLAIDRLDYTKGVLRRLQAYEEFLTRNPNAVDECVLVQVATPSRETVIEYASLRDEVEKAVGRINGAFSKPGHVAVEYFRRNFTREELVSYYVAADVMLVTPLRDGMNLVAKEYVACRSSNSGVLVLSQFAGAARELSRALQVNPRDQTNFVETIEAAVKMPKELARARMTGLRKRVKRNDVFAWCDDFLGALRR